MAPRKEKRPSKIPTWLGNYWSGLSPRAHFGAVAIFALLIVAAAAHLVIEGLTEWESRKQLVRAETERRAETILRVAQEIRSYVRDVIRPKLQTLLPPDEFRVDIMSSSYIARSILRRLEDKEGNFEIRFLSRHPLNPSNFPSPDEAAIIEFFERHPEAQSWCGEIRQGQQSWYAVARVRRLDSSCLACHSLGAESPLALRKVYTLAHGHPQEGDVTVDLVRVSVTDSLAKVQSELLRNTVSHGLMQGIFVVGLVVLAWLSYSYQRRITDRMAQLTGALEQVAEAGETFILAVDCQGKIFWVAEAAERMLGLAKSELLGHSNWRDLVTENDGRGAAEFWDKLLAEGRCRPQELRLKTRADEAKWFLVAGHSIRLRKLREPIYLLSFTNVDEKRKTHEALESALANFRSLLEVLPAGMLIVGADCKIRYANDLAARLLQEASPDQLVGQVCRRFVHDCEAHGGGWCKAIMEERGIPKEVLLRTVNGREFPALLSHVRLQWDGETVLAKLFVDVSEQKAREIELRQLNLALEAANRTLEELYQAAESATRAKSEFLANMSHEIRTPLTAILGYTELLLSEAASKPIAPQQREALEIIYRNGQYLLRLIEDILDLAKIEAGKLRVEKTRCHLPTLLSDILSLMRVRANAKNLSLTVENDGPVPEEIETDPVRLRQILINLIGNAIKFTELGGVRVVVRTTKSTENTWQLIFEVVDSGIGIPPEHLDRIFEPFHQVDGSASRRHGGTGLGLTISRRLAQSLGGDITVRSVVGQGSTFCVTIDPGDLSRTHFLTEGICSAERRPRSASSPAATDIRFSGRILLAEDGPDNQRFFEFILRRAGACVTIVEDGQQAVEIALAAEREGRPFDLILMDMQMPVVDGYEATRQLRAAGYSRPIIALTAHAMEGAAEECRAAGCDDYIAKPVDRLAFLQKVAEVLRQSAAQPGQVAYVPPCEPIPATEEPILS